MANGARERQGRAGSHNPPPARLTSLESLDSNIRSASSWMWRLSLCFLMTRLELLTDWLHALAPDRPFTLAPASSDASFRRYFRVGYDDGKTSIVMDAPPEQEDVRPWLAVQRLFAEAGVHVPAVLAADEARGFLLLSDLGGTTLLAALGQASASEIEAHYRAAIDALLRIQLASRPNLLPAYDRALLLREMALFPEWYCARHRGKTLGNDALARLYDAFEAILAVNLGEPAVFVHRDYHSRNLMCASPHPGIIDFQDAVHGPVSYDLVSLLKDAYIELPEEFALDLLARYWETAKKSGLPVRHDFAEFFREYEWMGVQRHLKVLGIFARLAHRDGKDGYLADMPLVSHYLRAACARYATLTPVLRLLDAVEERQVQTGYTF